MNKNPVRAWSSLLLTFLCISGWCQAQEAPTQATTSQVQTRFTRVYGPEDHDVAVPTAILPLGRKDAAALQAIIDFLKAINGANWTGMQATGTLTSPRGDEEPESTATLTVVNGDAFRLDVNAPDGNRSIRVQGNDGQILESDGVKHLMPFATAKNGLFAFPKLMVATFPSTQTSIIDQTTVPVDGRSLHRITIEEPVFAQRNSPEVSVTDLYFDPATHLLMKSVASVQLDTKDRAVYVQAITYGDYRKIGTMLLPFAYRQTLNGQRQWTLQLTNIQLTPSVGTTYFRF